MATPPPPRPARPESVGTGTRAAVADLVPLRMDEAPSAGYFSQSNHEIEVLLKDLPESIAFEAPAPAAPLKKITVDAAEEFQSIQEELSAFLENLPEGREESTSRVEAPTRVATITRRSSPRKTSTRSCRRNCASSPRCLPETGKEDLHLDFECPACGAGDGAREPAGRSILLQGLRGEVHDRAERPGPPRRQQAGDGTQHENLRPTKKAVSDRINDRLEQALFYWQDIPQAVKTRGFMTVVVLALLPLIVNFVFLNDPLKNQSLRTVDALVHVNQDQLKAISTEKTKDDTLQWMNLVSTVVKKRLDGGAKTRVQIAAQDSKSGSATVMVYFESKEQAARQGVLGGLGAANDTLMAPPEGEEEQQLVSQDGEMKFLVLLWQKSPQGKWQLEGNKTLEYANKLAAASAPPPPTRPGRRGAPKSVRPPKAVPEIYGLDGGPPRRELISDHASMEVLVVGAPPASPPQA